MEGIKEIDAAFHERELSPRLMDTDPLGPLWPSSNDPPLSVWSTLPDEGTVVQQGDGTLSHGPHVYSYLHITYFNSLLNCLPKCKHQELSHKNQDFCSS